MAKKKTDGCLICGKKGTLNRGLCSTHHSRYYKETQALTPEQLEEYSNVLIERGLLLPKKKPGPKVEENQFRSLAAEMFEAATKKKKMK